MDNLRAKRIPAMAPALLALLLFFFSGCEQPANTRLPETPGRPRVVPGNRQLGLSWDKVPAATAYEVWFGKSELFAMAELYLESYVTETSVTITGLDNYNTYYVWIRALNNAGSSGFSPRSQGMPEV